MWIERTAVLCGLFLIALSSISRPEENSSFRGSTCAEQQHTLACVSRFCSSAALFIIRLLQQRMSSVVAACS